MSESHDDQLLSVSLQQAKRHFDFDDVQNGQIKDFDKLFHLLHSEVKRLIDVDFGGLLNILYRIDVPEPKVKQILSLSAPEDVSRDLAAAILERLRQKAITRNKYS